jgi:charged multivesicular body protein 1
MASKCEKDEKAEKLKVKKAIEKGDPEVARIYAQNAIRMKNTGVGYLRLSSRLDAVASRVESAQKMKAVTKQMGSVANGMDKVLQTMDVSKISAVMDKFEASFEDMDVRSQYVEGALNSATATSTSEDAVESLLEQVATEHALDFKTKAVDASTAPLQEQEPGKGEDALEQRLAALRSQ